MEVLAVGNANGSALQKKDSVVTLRLSALALILIF